MSKHILISKSLLKRLPDFNAYEKTLQQFIKTNTHGANLEKLHYQKCSLYSIRGNKKSRLILMPIKREGQQYWLWVDVLEDHQYKALARKPKEWTLEDVVPLALPVAQEDVAHEEEEEEEIEFIEEADVEHHLQNYILLDEQQKKAKYAPLPLIISGAPGAGKSSTAMALLKYAAEKHADAHKRFLYITQSSVLAALMQKEWEENAVDSACEVHFKTPFQLFIEQGGDAKSLVDESFFLKWYQERCKKSHAIEKVITKQTLAAPGIPIEDAAKVYQEFRTLSGYSTFAEYNLEVGSKYSLFKDEATRLLVWQAYEAYQQSLNEGEHKRVDLHFAPIRSPAYDLIVMDEAQDVSRIQLNSLIPLATGHNLAFCIGDHQQLYGSECIVPFIKSQYKKQGDIHATHIPLVASYRCPKKVVQLANALLQLKYQAIGGSLFLDKNQLLYVTAQEDMEEGNVHWVDKKEELNPFCNDKDNVDFAVITSATHFEEAQELFGVERVFTAETIKGLQYQKILLYYPLDNEKFIEANKVIGEGFHIQTDLSKAHIAKNSEGNMIHNIPFNELFVSITRTQASLSIYQPQSAGIRHIHTCLKKFTTESNHTKIHPHATPTVSTPEEVQQRVEVLREQNLHQQAKAMQAKIGETATIKAPGVQEHERLCTLLASNPQDSLTLAHKGDILRQQGRFEQALIILNQALALKPDNDFALARRGAIFRKQGKYEEALSNLNQAIQLNPNNDFALARRGALLLSMGIQHHDQACDDLTRAIELNTNNDFALARRGVLFFLRGDKKRALLDLNQALLRNASNGFALAYRGMIFHHQNNLEDALSDLNQAIALNPYINCLDLINRGEVLYLQNKLEDALRDFNQVIQLKPSHVSALKNRGEILYYQGDFDGALNDFDRVLQLKPHDDFALAARGKILLQQNKLFEAWINCNQAIQLNPANGNALTSMGEIWYRKGGLEEALNHVTKAIQLDPFNERALTMRGEILSEQKQWNPALEDFNHALQLNPDNISALSHRAEILFLHNKWDEALRDVNAVLQLDPDNEFALTYRADIVYEQSRLDAVLLDLHQATEDNSEENSSLKNSHALGFFKSADSVQETEPTDTEPTDTEPTDKCAQTLQIAYN